jgi:hypothetical protein
MAEPIKPVKVARWATNLVQNDLSGQVNRIEPIGQKTLIGFDYNEIPTRQDFNYLFNNHGEWLEYLSYFHNRPLWTLKNNLPPASENKGVIYYVSDVSGGCLAISNGTDWKKISLGGNI